MSDEPKRYRDSFSGKFSGIIPWEKFDELWGRLKADPEGWYVYRPDSDDVPPDVVHGSKAFLAFLEEADEFLHEQQYADYCGAVYVDNIQKPQFIKIFHPRKMGSGCSIGGGSHTVILPWWTVSRVRPEKMRGTEQPEPKKKGLVAKFLKG